MDTQHNLASVTDPQQSDSEDMNFKHCYIPPSIPREQLETYINRDSVITSIKRPYDLAKEELVSSGRTFENTTYLSFGDNGTTASITEWGQLMQITRYLGPGQSSLFVVDRASTEEPFSIRLRANDLWNMPRFFSYGFGNDITTAKENFSPILSLRFIRGRWPSVMYSSEGIEIVLQCMVHNGVVIQQYIVKNTGDESIEFQRVFNVDVLIRNLDFTDPMNSFNDDGSQDNANYSESPGPNGYGFVKVHRFAKTEGDRPEKYSGISFSKKPVGDKKKDKGQDFKQDNSLWPEAVGVVMGLFVDGIPQQYENFGNSFVVHPNTHIEVTAGYKLVLLTSEIMDWKRLVISAAQVDIDLILAKTASPSIQNIELNYYTRRNIEHILSVCALPASLDYIWDHDFPDIIDAEQSREPAVVLTCGDISGHRVCSSASFAAFRLLTTIARYLELHTDISEPDGPSEGLWKRIKDTCVAHLRWVFFQAKVKNGTFSANYWPNGNIILHTAGLPADSPADTPYQILKLFEFCRSFQGAEEKKFVKGILHGPSEESVKDWVRSIDKVNKRGSYAWRHSPRTEVASFRLEDHAWIWNALRFLSIEYEWEKVVKSSKRDIKRPRLATENPFADPEWVELVKRYDLPKMQREIIKRFTTENEHSKERMIALTRSARVNRFMLHSRDTALFYNGFDGMFTNHPDVWTNLLHSQKLQEYHQEMEWDNPLRYALAIVLATSGYSINTLSNELTFRIAKDTLIETMLPNGLFPGQIDPITKEDVLFEDEYYRDSYYHITFEVPYVLWEFKSEVVTSPTVTTPTVKTDVCQPKHQDIPSSRAASNIETILRDISQTSGLGLDVTQKPRGLQKRKIPFNKFVDTLKIVNIEEEWLYDYPEFLDYTPLPEYFTVDAIRDSLRKNPVEVLKKAIDDFLTFSKDKPSHEEDRTYEAYTLEASSDYDIGKIVDVPKLRIHGKKSLERRNRSVTTWEPLPAIFMQMDLREPRTTEKAKKRLIWLASPRHRTVLTCYLTTHPAEQTAISLFFERHANHETYFSEDAILVHNIWETEFHLSFFQLSRPLEDNPPALTFVAGLLPRELPLIDKRQLVQISSGYRFLGDFMDRYWTCHFIEPGSGGEATENAFKKVEKTWTQRKVLEHILFNRILTEVNSSTQEIVEVIGKELSSLKSFATLKMEAYFDATLKWRDIRQILETLENSFDKIISAVSQWESREQDRLQQPRWTNDDERKHRDTIRILVVESNKRLRELRGYQATVKSQRGLLEASQERFRSELEFQGNASIQYFTYATVFFLPLGFSSSLFSMSQTPSGAILANLAKVAVVMVILTLVFVIGFQKVLLPLKKAFLSLRNWLYFYARSAMFSTYMILTALRMALTPALQDVGSRTVSQDETQQTHEQGHRGWRERFHLPRLGRKRSRTNAVEKGIGVDGENKSD